MGRSQDSNASVGADESKLSKSPNAWLRASANPKQRNIPNTIVHLTAAAAAKAAATALLTNQVVSGVSVTLSNGKSVTFKVAKCLIESGSVICSVLGNQEVPVETPFAAPPEIWVRVAWEQSLVPTFTKVAPDLSATVQVEDSANFRAELHWLSLDNDSADSESELPLVPLLLYFGTTPPNAPKMQDIPRESIIGAVKEALSQVPPHRLEQGVKVVVSLTNDAEAAINTMPYIQTSLAKPGLPELERKLSRLILALDPVASTHASLLSQAGDETWLSLPALHLSLKAALQELNRRPAIKTLAISGNLATIVALADNNLSGLPYERIREGFISSLLFGRDLPPGVVQSLKMVTNPSDLLHIINRQRVGWLLDELCRLACLNLRKMLPSMRLESIIFGSSGAILGRATIEPGVFQL